MSVEFNVVIRCADEIEIQALYQIAKQIYEQPVCKGLQRIVAKRILDALQPIVGTEKS